METRINWGNLTKKKSQDSLRVFPIDPRFIILIEAILRGTVSKDTRAWVSPYENIGKN